MTKRKRVMITLTIVSVLLCTFGNIFFHPINNYNGDLDLASGLLLLFAFAITGGSIIGSFPLSIVNISMALKNIFIRKEEKLSFNLFIVIINSLIIITTISVFIYFEFIAA